MQRQNRSIVLAAVISLAAGAILDSSQIIFGKKQAETHKIKKQSEKKRMIRKNMIAVFLLTFLLFTLAGCSYGQSAADDNPVSQTPEPLSGTEVFQKIEEAHVVREILAQHKNVQENAVYFDEQGNVLTSIYIYADNEMRVWENDRSYVDIQYRDSFYTYDPDTEDKVIAGFGIEGVYEEYWESRMDAPLDFVSDGSEEIAEITESDGRITLTIVSSADAEFYPEEFKDEIEPGTKTVCKMEVDAETYMIYEGETYLQKPDGTERKVGEFQFSYDVAPYEPSAEMLQVINGTDKTVRLIVNPGTEQEKYMSSPVVKTVSWLLCWRMGMKKSIRTKPVHRSRSRPMKMAKEPFTQ